MGLLQPHPAQERTQEEEEEQLPPCNRQRSYQKETHTSNCNQFEEALQILTSQASQEEKV